jgi:signal transduction histidine kinase
MRILPKRLFSSLTLIVSLATILVALAVLQYRWSGQISKAEHESMRSSLKDKMDQFSLQFYNELWQLDVSLRPNPADLMLKNWNSYAANCDSLLRSPNHRLVSNIYLWVAGRNNGSQLLKLNRNTKAFDASSWPSNFETIRDRYDHYFSNPARQEPEFRPFMSNFSFRIPLIIQPLSNFQGASPGAFQRRPGPPGGGMPPGGRPPGSGTSSGGMQRVGFLLIELDRESLRNDLFPELVQKYFKGPDYQVAIIGGRNHDTLLYQSDPHLTIASFNSADAKIGLMENRFGPMMMARPDRDLGSSGRGRDSDSQGRGRDFDSQSRGTVGPPGMQFRQDPQLSNGNRRRGPPAFFNDPGSGWELVAKHRLGSLDAAVAATRRRNLEFSFGSLLLLAASTAFIIASARRAQSLARLQIDFVAGISHELRTPLAVICSAGDNLAEGVIAEAGNSTRKYGELIRNEGRKLAGMIEQILQYAGGRKGRRRYTLRPEHLNDIADAALNQLQPSIDAAGFSVEKSFAPNLPLIHVEANALTQAIQNLIQNALKYSDQSRWVAIRTSKVQRKRDVQVLLTVEDKGMGIASADLPHIFEPFYRGSAATEAQIHGTGLGLYMVRETLIAMGGTISAKSSPGKGSIFTICLPAMHVTDGSLASEG